jgi:hypothetical protein
MGSKAIRAERWQEIDQLLEAALEQEPNQRLVFFQQACAGDDELHWDLEDLPKPTSRPRLSGSPGPEWELRWWLATKPI